MFSFLVEHLSPGQISFVLLYLITLGTWLYAECLGYIARPDLAIQADDGDLEKDKHEDTQEHKYRDDRSDWFVSASLIRCLRLDPEALIKHRQTLRAMAEFGSLMMWYFLCDRTEIFPAGVKSYSRDLFLFIFLILTLVAFGSSIQTSKVPVLLNRGQTEEWKGWMQVLFLLYHYFEAKEYYNAIRMFIACYVWMTGFGNFCYYYKTKDFSIGRFSQMMWRLNFLVACVCVVLRNSYMLYYICPMHTIFTVMVYASLGIAPHLNTSHFWISIKLIINVGLVLLLWDCKPVFYAIWSPLKGLVGYVDPRRPSEDALYEWYFRSSLDRFVWIYGMLCAQLYPFAANALTAIDNMPPVRAATVRATVLAACGAGFYAWYSYIFVLPKVEYNAVHPYTSWIPITLWLVVRNLTPNLRLSSLHLYGWLGTITLETYISQFHIWLRSSIPDGQPKGLLMLIPGYPLLNFALCTALYVIVSRRLFELTNTLKNAFVPHSNNQQLLRNFASMAVSVVLLFSLSWLLTLSVRHVTGFQDQIRPSRILQDLS